MNSGKKTATFRRTGIREIWASPHHDGPIRTSPETPWISRSLRGPLNWPSYDASASRAVDAHFCIPAHSGKQKKKRSIYFFYWKIRERFPGKPDWKFSNDLVHSRPRGWRFSVSWESNWAHHETPRTSRTIWYRDVSGRPLIACQLFRCHQKISTIKKLYGKFFAKKNQRDCRIE